MLSEKRDAYGQEIYAFHKGIPAAEIVERDDGFIDISTGPQAYFAPFNKWPSYEKKAIRFARGRVLDVGCGAGRVLFYLQEKGLECVGIDNSPLAIKVCRERGAKDARPLPLSRVGPPLGKFDTVVMFGNNFSLLGNRKKAHWLLQKFYRLTNPEGLIIAASVDPYPTKKPEHVMYHKFNLRRGRMGGQLRLRIRFEKYITPWFDFLMVSPDEMKELVDGTGWQIKTFINAEESGSAAYAAIMERIQE